MRVLLTYLREPSLLSTQNLLRFNFQSLQLARRLDLFMKEMIFSLLRGYEPKLAAGKLLDIKHIQEEEVWRKQRGKDFIRRTTLACVLAATFNVYTALSLLSCFFPLYAEKHLNASKMTIGIIFAAHPIAEIFFCPVASLMCKRMGRFAVFNFGLTLVAIGIFFFGFAQTISQFMFARLLEGVGSTCVQVNVHTLSRRCSTWRSWFVLCFCPFFVCLHQCRFQASHLSSSTLPTWSEI